MTLPAATSIGGPQPAAPSTPAALPSPAAQLAMRLVPLRTAPDGVHRLTVHLNPGDLGPISVTAEVRAGAITVHLAGATGAGREALDAALPDLRRHLTEGGYGSCALEIRPHVRDATTPGPTSQQQASQPDKSQPDQYGQAGFQRQHGQDHGPGTHDATLTVPGDAPDHPATEPRPVDAPHRALDLRV
jgi:flagellar hook-length control protein FliK